jgi:hypothetical protein
MVHHPGHHALPAVSWLHCDVGYSRHDYRGSGQRHLNPVRMSAADNAALIEYGDGTLQVETGPQLFRFNGQPVAISPRLNPNPLGEFVIVYRPQFQHRVYSPGVPIGFNQV